MDALAERLNGFDDGDCPDESTVRRKLAECEKLGLVAREKRGRETRYRRAADGVKIDAWRDALDFFSEAAPLGVIGDFCRDKLATEPSLFRFKHHYILSALDSDVLCDLFLAIREHREVTADNYSLRYSGAKQVSFVPLKVLISAQGGRQYLIGYSREYDQLRSYRVDYLSNIKITDVAEDFNSLRKWLKRNEKHMWGVTLRNSIRGYDKVEMTVKIGENEEYIINRLEREKRCGEVEIFDEHTVKFTAEVFDAHADEIFDEAENRLHAQKAVMYLLMKD
jgi:DNA-binding transcriptional ArsR family regulator